MSIKIQYSRSRKNGTTSLFFNPISTELDPDPAISFVRTVFSLNRTLNTVSPSLCVVAVPGTLVKDPTRVTGKLPAGATPVETGVPLICMI